MAFGAEELRVLRRALALALHPSSASAEDVQDCLLLAESVDEAVHEDARLRAFLVADLARYRAALPGSAIGYLALLKEALATGYQPGADDLAALRALRGNPVAAVLLDRCRSCAEQTVRDKPAGQEHEQEREQEEAEPPLAAPPASRTRLLALPGGLAAREEPAKPKPKQPPAERPAPPRPVPTPAEVFPPKRRPAPPPAPPQKLAVG